MHVVPASSVFGRLPVVLAGDTGTIPFKYSAGLRSGAHHYDHNLTRADVLCELVGSGLVQGYVNEELHVIPFFLTFLIQN